MEEDINYSTVVFRNRPPAKSSLKLPSGPAPGQVEETEEKEEATIYSAIRTTHPVTTKPNEKEEARICSGVNAERPLTTEPKGNEDLPVYSEVKGKDSATPVTTVPYVYEATSSRTVLLLVCLGILGVFLVASIVIIIYFTMAMNKQEADLSSLTAKNEQLIAEIRNLENQTEELIVQKRNLENRTEELNVEKTILVNRTEQLRRDREELNRTLGIILTFDNFPVKDFCPGKKCQPCVRGWTLYQNKCYLFVWQKWKWNTWYKSREFCKNRAADLVVIDDLQEQEFIITHIEFYHSEYHGYWLGLRRKDDNWTWIDGRKNTLGFWIRGTFPDSNSYALMIFRKNVTENWSKNQPGFRNRFICEREALIRSD